MGGGAGSEKEEGLLKIFFKTNHLHNLTKHLPPPPPFLSKNENENENENSQLPAILLAA